MKIFRSLPAQIFTFVLVALAWNNGVRRTRYPQYW